MTFRHLPAWLNGVCAPAKQVAHLGDVRAREINYYVLKCASVQIHVKIPIATKRRIYMRVKAKFRF